MNRLALALVTLLSMCAFARGESESAREARAMQGAIPQRLSPDGGIHLTPADRTALGLAVTPGAEAELPESEMSDRCGIQFFQLPDHS